MTIHFKNGTSKKVSSEIAEVIAFRIIEGTKQFQVFYNGDDLKLIINLGEVLYID